MAVLATRGRRLMWEHGWREALESLSRRSIGREGAVSPPQLEAWPSPESHSSSLNLVGLVDFGVGRRASGGQQGFNGGLVPADRREVQGRAIGLRGRA